MSDVTTNGPSLYAQLAHRMRVSLGEFNDTDRDLEGLVRELAEFKRAHLTQPAQCPYIVNGKGGSSYCRLAESAQPAQAVDVDDAMVERALTRRAIQEDGAVWPDAYSDDEQAAEREQMQKLLAAALNTQGPKAYCRACQRAGMSNCQHFDECTGATCITCHRPFAAALPKDSNGAEGVTVVALQLLVAAWRERENRDSRGSGEYYSGRSQAYEICADELSDLITTASQGGEGC